LVNPERERLLPNLSVRTGLDLFLQGANLPIGSEIIMTSINIPDMNTVLRHHGLISVPVEVDVDTLAPEIEDIEKNITERTKAIMLSYVWGVNFNIDKIIQLAKKHNLYVIEDLAETFTSTKYNGHPEADISLFSFGTIKYNTALNGAITVVRNNDVLYRKMKYIQDLYPMQLTSTYHSFELLLSLIPKDISKSALKCPSCLQPLIILGPPGSFNMWQEKLDIMPKKKPFLSLEVSLPTENSCPNLDIKFATLSLQIWH